MQVAEPIVITVQDLTTEGTYSPVELERMVWSIRYQLLYQFNRSPWVERDACPPITDMVLIARDLTPPANTWHAELLNTLDEPGALGYHENQAFKKNTEGTRPEKASTHSSRGFRADAPHLPLMKIGVQISKEDGVQPSEVLSHEALESAVDPNVVNESEIRKYLDPATSQFYIGEICDAVQGRSYDVGQPEKRPCSFPEAIVADFVYLSYFGQPQQREFTTFAEECGLRSASRRKAT